MLNRSAIVLAGGFSDKFGQDKAVLELNGKPMLSHVISTATSLVDEVIVVTRSEERKETYAEFLGSGVKFAVDIEAGKGPLIGALTGFEIAQGKHSLLLASDMPLVSLDVVTLLFDLCPGKSAVIPRWPNQQIAPLQAVYHTKTALEAARLAVADGEYSLSAMVDNMGGIRYLSTLALQAFDPELRTFFNVNMPLDLKLAEGLLTRKTKRRSK
ncbi:MAG: molybdenum cofactor guanylyltransferase [Candidatus Bathyarchaeota archaeon]|nr:molybdenum cofactor guanylyltransferase [Candidatus Bathyarchaeota archaeon]